VRSEACISGIIEKHASSGASGAAAASAATASATVVAVISGSAVNQDGRSSSLTAPNGPAQQRAVRLSLTAAGMEGRSVDVLQMHGTGTSLGRAWQILPATSSSTF
jgi:acyl transferase domain-containing protein